MGNKDDGDDCADEPRKMQTQLRRKRTMHAESEAEAVDNALSALEVQETAK